MSAVRDQARRSPSPAMSWVQALIRFALEIAMLLGLGYWGYSLSSTTLVRLPLAVLIPGAAAVAWTVFRTPGDASAGKDAIVPIPGWARLLLEIGLFLLTAYGTWTAGSRIAAEMLLTFAGLHYLVTWPRVRWLLGAGSSSP